nr:MAG TPA: hypothetical protein [Inoviridae sp.]
MCILPLYMRYCNKYNVRFCKYYLKFRKPLLH